MSILENIPERDLPVSSPSAVDHVRGVTAAGKSMRFPVGGADGLATNAEMSAALADLDARVDTAVDEINEAAGRVLATNPAPKFSAFGGQLRKLRAALTDPLHQTVGICLIGDSITWGQTLPDNSATDPRNGTLSDPRNNATASSWANILRRYIGSEFMRGADPVLSNWAAAPSGQSITEYKKTFALFPVGAPFVAEVTGGSTTITEVQSAGALLGYQLRLNHGATTDEPHARLRFPITGSKFTLVYGMGGPNSASYEVLINGASIGIFTTADAPSGAKNRRVHTFPYVRGATVEIRTRRPAAVTGPVTLYIEAIEIEKLVRISNQGINGATTATYLLYNLSGDFSNPTAVTPEDDFIIMQLGTNDRVSVSSRPRGPQGFRRNADLIVDELVTLGDVILMCANPAAPEDPALYSSTMSDIRGVLFDVAKTRSIDIIDNYAAFAGLPVSDYTADNLHPNLFGHSIIAKNIIGSLEMS